jgi:hypothetical protein
VFPGSEVWMPMLAIGSAHWPTLPSMMIWTITSKRIVYSGLSFTEEVQAGLSRSS